MRPVRQLLLLALLASCLIACTGEERGPDVPLSSDGSCSDDLVKGLTAWGSSGFSGVVLVDGADTSCRIAVGMADRDEGREMTPTSVFSIGSVSKTLVAAAVLQLQAEGRLSLQETAGHYLPTLAGPAASASIESLLLHTSGLVGSHGQDHVPLSHDEAIAAIGALDVDESAVGTFLYSNAGYTLLALVVEEASGVEYRDYMTDRVLPARAGFWSGEPAADGARAIGYADDQPTEQLGDFEGPHWALEGNGDVAMSALQLADWTRDLFSGATFDPSVAETMSSPAIEHAGQAITVGWVLQDQDLLGEPALASAGGGGDIGHNVVVAWLPTSDRVVVVASNQDRVTAEVLAQSIGPATLTGDPVPRPDASVSVDADMLSAAAGTYETTSGGRFEVTVDGDALVVTPVGSDALAAVLPTLGRSDEQVTTHEEAVADLLQGRGQVGADELAVLEESSGDLRGVEILGSTVEEGELRTYVRLTFDGDEVEGWYALNEKGGINAVDLSGAPSARLVAVTGGRYRVGAGPDNRDAVTVTFDETSMTVTGPSGTLRAGRT